MRGASLDKESRHVIRSQPLFEVDRKENVSREQVERLARYAASRKMTDNGEVLALARLGVRNSASALDVRFLGSYHML